MLTALVGAPAALAACRHAARPPTFSGRLLGQDAALGHRLRDGFRPAPTEPPQEVGVLVLGAGPAGLSAAWKLRRSGCDDVRVLDLEAQPGGTSTSGRNAVSAYPWGAHYVPVPLPHSRALIELFDEMGVIEDRDATGQVRVREELLCRAPQERLFRAGVWSEGLYPHLGATVEDARQLRAFEAEVNRWVDFRDPQGRRAFAVPLAYGAEHPDLDALDRLSMADWLRQHQLTSERLRWYVEYACRDDYGATLETTSAYAGLLYFAARVERAGTRAAEFVTWPEGNGRLVEHLSRPLGERLSTRMAVTDVRPTDTGVEVWAFDAERQRPVAYRAQHAVFAMPRHLAARLIGPWRESPPSFLSAFESSAWMVANLTLRDRPREESFPLSWDNVLYDSKSLGYVVATHQTGKDYDASVWTYYLPFVEGEPRAARQTLLSADWAHWADAVVADLGRAHPDLAGLIENLDVWRWGHAMVRPTVGLLRGAALRAAREPLGRLHFAHTDLSGVALFEEAQYWGVHAAEAILRERGLAFRSSL
jgi:protoporphyrinogen oxidase